MYPYSAAEVTEALRRAKNPNAAIKRALKCELPKGDPGERFVKEIRAVVGAKSSEPLEHLISKGFEKFHPQLIAILRQAYSEPLSIIAEQVIGRYADEFNNTFERVDSGIRVKDEAAFRGIFEEVGKLFEQRLAEHSLGPSALMKAVLTTCVFDADVLMEASKSQSEAFSSQS